MTGGTVEQNVFGGGMGMPTDSRLGICKNTNVNIEGGTVRKNVYGGANAAIVLGDANVLIGK